MLKSTSAPPEDQSLIPSTHAGQLATVCDSSSMESNAFFWPLWALHIKKIRNYIVKWLKKIPDIALWPLSTLTYMCMYTCALTAPTHECLYRCLHTDSLKIMHNIFWPRPPPVSCNELTKIERNYLSSSDSRQGATAEVQEGSIPQVTETWGPMFFWLTTEESKSLHSPGHMDDPGSVRLPDLQRHELHPSVR